MKQGYTTYRLGNPVKRAFSFMLKSRILILYRRCEMNKFEKEVQDNSNDIVPSAVGFIASFGFFALIFIIANIVDVASFL